MGRKLGSIYLVIATWAFLVLPTCPCQMLIVCGVDVHGVLNRPQEVSITSQARGFPIGACHCEQDVLKSAEIANPCVDGEVACTEDGSPLADWGFIDLWPCMAQLEEALVHPPPEVDCRTNLSERFCVYRL